MYLFFLSQTDGISLLPFMFFCLDLLLLLFKTRTFMQKERVRVKSVPDLAFREISVSLCLSLSLSKLSREVHERVKTKFEYWPLKLKSLLFPEREKIFSKTTSLFLDGDFGAQKHPHGNAQHFEHHHTTTTTTTTLIRLYYFFFHFSSLSLIAF